VALLAVKLVTIKSIGDQGYNSLSTEQFKTSI